MTPPASGPVLAAEDLHRMAWEMHHDGMSWRQIADELEEPLAAVERMATAYEHLTDTAAAENQHTLF
ncbi:hypothetical protein [Gordonia rubripertincta]|uniref:Uncharacterized protein n=1 Tax=Gordonia rubripertincta TaxID=36822 RepID=A0ABT4N5V9_GORRU|nr:hypothetical protein [Gordonia rubripertincta]MCZ4553661.1 hypothetical protein [Gordonia rubripertincta]